MFTSPTTERIDYGNQANIPNYPGLTHTHNIGNVSPDMLERFRQQYPLPHCEQRSLKEDILARLRSLNPFGFLQAIRSGQKVFVFLVHNEEALVIEDGWDLFPSDTLITQLRLIAGAPTSTYSGSTGVTSSGSGA